MNNITMIPIEQLMHHPQNPRLDLGDLTELAESIRQNGVMQNLTVVQGHMMSKGEWTAAARAEGADRTSAEASYDPERAWVSGGYTVVIGNRRMEAAKQAGLTELPCVISDMDHKTQVATMLMENMQRADLTVYEQAQGFQMMMDLGYSAAEIAEKTGFGETTVRRRIKMAEMDPKLLKKACDQKGEERQITMMDFDRLAQVESLKERNSLLKDIGERNFEWRLTKAIQVQQSHKVKKDAVKALKEAGATEIKSTDRYCGKYDQLWGKSVKLYEWTPGKKVVPDSKEPLFYFIDDTEIDFYTKRKPQKKEKQPEKTEKEKEEDRQRELAWKTADRCAEVSADLRARFAEGLTVNPKNSMRMMQWAMAAAFGCMLDYDTPTMTLTQKLGVNVPLIPDKIAEVSAKIMEMPQKQWPNLILLMFTGDYEGAKRKPPTFAEGSRGCQFPQYKKNVRLELCYEWLTEFGYQMSTEEAEMMAGTHEIFKKGKKGNA